MGIAEQSNPAFVEEAKSRESTVLSAPLLYLEAKTTVQERFALRVQITRHFLAFRASGGSADAFVAALKEKRPLPTWIPTARSILLWARAVGTTDRLEKLLPKKPGPTKSRLVTEEVYEIMMSMMCGSYPTTGAKKQPRKTTVASNYADIVKECERRGITPVPCLRTLVRAYDRVPSLEKDAAKLDMRALDGKYGVRSTNEVSDDCIVQLDHSYFDYIDLKRGQRTYRLQLSLGMEKGTKCLLSPTWLEGSVNGEKLRAVLFNSLTFDSEPHAPTLIPVNVIEIDGESPHRALKKNRLELAPLGADVKIGVARRPWQRGAIENRNKFIANILFPQLEVVIREFCTRNGSHIVTGEAIEKVYALLEEHTAKIIHAHNSEVLPETGKSRLESFREKFDSERHPLQLLSAKFFCKENLCTAQRVRQLQVTLTHRSKAVVYHEDIKQGTKYRVLRLRGSEEVFHLFNLDGSSLGVGTVLRPGTVKRNEAQSASKMLLREMKEKAARRRAQGAESRLKNIVDLPLPKEGTRKVLRDGTVAGVARRSVRAEPSLVPVLASPTSALQEQASSRRAFQMVDLGIVKVD